MAISGRVISKSIYLILFSVFLPASAALAVPIINIGPPTPSQGGYLAYYQGEFQTLGSFGKNASQPITIDFDGDLSGLADILTGSGRLSLDGILGMGPANLNNGIVEQKTRGGTFSLFSDAAETDLLLSGNIITGAITGALGQNQAASFQSWELDITGGSLKTSYWDKMIDLRIDMGNLDDCIIISKRCFIHSVGAPPNVPGGSILLDGNGNLQGFRANIVDGFISAKGGTTPPTDVPEPATALLMMLGGALYPAKKRFARK